MRQKPSFLITIDVEGDNQWDTSHKITTHNASYLSRFQELCIKYGFKPTYLTNYEMAKSSQFQEFGNASLKNENAEIGMHLHPWNMPPDFKLTNNDKLYKPYLIEHPIQVMEDKIDYMTSLLEDTFNCPIVSHRAGRWGFNEVYAALIVKKGYKVDCSVTPHINWDHHLGDPNLKGGTDYTDFQQEEYYLDLEDITKEGNSDLLEIPVTIMKNNTPIIETTRKLVQPISPLRKIVNYYIPKVVWLRPNGKNINQMKKILKKAILEERTQVEFMLHSSELMPNGSPTFKTKHSIEMLYLDLEELFIYASQHFIGMTLHEFYKQKQCIKK